MSRHRCTKCGAFADGQDHAGQCPQRSAPVGETNGRWAGGKSSHPLYHTYNDMLGRCYRASHKRFADYGGRGIEVCERWRADFWNFVNDMGERPTGLVLDRVDNDGPYTPSNCRWTTYSQSSHNRRRHGHEDRERNEIGQFA